MIRSLTLTATLLMATTIEAQQQPSPQVIRWSELTGDQVPDSGEIVQDAELGGEALVVTHTESGPAQFELVEITEPQIVGQRYLIRGRIRYTGVQGTGFLEMITHMPDGSWYFSRTLGKVGPMQSIEGDSTWREFQLPFDLGTDPATPKPSRLVINLNLAGPGTVVLSDLTLEELAVAENRGAWWSDRTAGFIGGGLGTTIGFLGALVGILMGLRIARPVVIALLAVMCTVGSLLLVAGILAIGVSQPYGVWYPLILTGAISTVVSGICFLVLHYTTRASELRRMQALDAQ